MTHACKKYVKQHVYFGIYFQESGHFDAYMFKVNNRNTTARCGICSKLTIKTPEHISHLVAVFLLLTLNIWMPAWMRVIGSLLHRTKIMKNEIFRPYSFLEHLGEPKVK